MSAIKRPPKSEIRAAVKLLRREASKTREQATTNRHNLSGFRPEFHQDIAKLANSQDAKASRWEKVAAWLEADGV